MTTTPKTTELQALLERVEAASGPDRELFLAIAEAVVPDYRKEIEWRAAFNSFVGVGAWTDAALALAERVLPDTSVAIKRWASGTGDAEIGGAGVPDFARARAASPALALIVATIKAMTTTQGEKT